MSWQRKLISYTLAIKQEPLIVENIIAWLSEQPDAYLLAHADDGVIWGRVENGSLRTSFDVIPDHYADVCPPLRLETLRQARLFSADWEILIWRADADWQCRIIEDRLDGETEAFDELQLLWGTYAKTTRSNDFTLLEDGQQGLRHAVPVAINFVQNKRQVALRVRHYLQENPHSGVNHIAYSRLVNIEVTNNG